jgi:hypothetical protein
MSNILILLKMKKTVLIFVTGILCNFSLFAAATDTLKSISLSEKSIKFETNDLGKQLKISVTPNKANVFLTVDFDSTIIEATISADKKMLEIKPVKEGTTNIVLIDTVSKKTFGACQIEVRLSYSDLQEKCTALEKELDALKKVNDEKGKVTAVTSDNQFPDWAFYAALALIVLLAAFLIFTIREAKAKSEKRQKQFRQFDNELGNRDARIEEIERFYFDSENRRKQAEKERDSYKAEIVRLKGQSTISPSVSNYTSSVRPTVPYTAKPITPPPPQPVSRYADSIIDGAFNKVTDAANDDTVFELLLKQASERIAEVTVFEPAKRRVLRNPDFIDGCEKSRLSANPVDLQVENGTAALQDNGKWQIIQKLKVKFV